MGGEETNVEWTKSAIMSLDIEEPNALADYLRRTGRIEPNETPEVEPLSGGVSNRTVLVNRPNGEAWVVKQALEKLRVATDWYSSPNRIHREAAGLRRLSELEPDSTVPFVFEDFDYHLLAMQAVSLPHWNWKSLLLAGKPCDDHIRQFGEILAGIHLKAFERRGDLALEFADCSFFESLRIDPYYAYTAAQIPEASCFYSSLISDTRQCAVTLVHGDYSPKNILVSQGRLILLDHEVIHWGDPAFDVGFSLTHLLSKGHHCAARRFEFARAARMYWQLYAESVANVAWMDGLEMRVVRHLLGCMLARVAGRSPLEYLDAAERVRQRQAVLELMRAAPATVEEAISKFIEAVDQNAGD
jgi:5-methylthioribose kinase